MADIVMQHVSYTYHSGTRALDDVSLEISGGVWGVIGANGAGKTTLFRVLLGALVPTSGSIELDGVSVDEHRRRRSLGFIPESPCFDESLTVDEFLQGLLHLGHRPLPGIAVRELAIPVALSDILSSRLGALSLGQKRRVELAAALIGDPGLVLFDEPTNGLDPAAVLKLRDAISAIDWRARTLLISSHHLDELQRLVRGVVIFREGRLVGKWEKNRAIAEFGSFEQLFHTTATEVAS